MPEEALHVAVAVIYNYDCRKVLLSKRQKGKHQEGKWEFPGGKVDSGEDVTAALLRELHEELGIHVEQSQALIKIHHDYPELSVFLDVWEIGQFSGEPHGREGQYIEWVSVDSLTDLDFPEANQPIIEALSGNS